MKTSESITEITKSLLSFQQSTPEIIKDKKGYGYDYISLDSIINKCKPVLNTHGIVLIQSVSECDNGVKVTTRLQHVSGEYFEDTFSLPSTDMKSVNKTQAIGASITYGKRYGLSAMLGISVDEDTDGALKTKESVQDRFIKVVEKSGYQKSEISLYVKNKYNKNVTQLSDIELSDLIETIKAKQITF